MTMNTRNQEMAFDKTQYLIWSEVVEVGLYIENEILIFTSGQSTR